MLCNNPYWTLLVTSRRNNAVSERHTNGKTATILEVFVTVDETMVVLTLIKTDTL